MRRKREDPYRKTYTKTKLAAKRRGISFMFTYEQWITFWGVLHDLRGRGGLNICRLRDSGAYSADNCYIGTPQMNRQDYRVFKSPNNPYYEKERNKWTVQYQINGTQQRVGRYNTKLEAQRAYYEIREKEYMSMRN